MRFKLFALLLALALLAVVPAASGQQERVDVYEGGKLVKSVVFVIGQRIYYVDGQARDMEDAVPFLESDRSYVPVRYLGYALGLTPADVSWSNEKQTATLRRGSTVLEMTIGVPQVVVNGEARPIDVAPVLRSEPSWRTYLPARFVAEGLGYEVDWDGSLGLVVCWPKNDQKPEEILAQVAKQVQGNPYVPEGWKRVVCRNGGAYVPPEAEFDERHGGRYVMEKGTLVQFDTGAVTISYPCRQYATESTDRLAKDLLLSNIGDPDLVEQIWEYGLQKTGRDYYLPDKYFPGAGVFKKFLVANGGGYVVVMCYYEWDEEWDKYVN